MKAFTRSLTIFTTGIFLFLFSFLQFVQSLQIDPPLPSSVFPGQLIKVHWKRNHDPLGTWDFQFIQPDQNNQPLGGAIDVDHSLLLAGSVDVKIPQEAKGTIELVAIFDIGNRQVSQGTLQVDSLPPDTGESKPSPPSPSPPPPPPPPPQTTTSTSFQSTQPTSTSTNTDTSTKSSGNSGETKSVDATSNGGSITQTPTSSTTRSFASFSASSTTLSITQMSLSSTSTTFAANYTVQSDTSGSGDSTGAPNQDRHGTNRAGIIAASVVGSLVLLIILAFLYFLWRRRQRAERARMSMRNWDMTQRSGGNGFRGDLMVRRDPWSLSQTGSNRTSNGYENSLPSQRLSSVRASTLGEYRYDRDTDLEDGTTTSESPSVTGYPSPGLESAQEVHINNSVQNLGTSDGITPQSLPTSNSLYSTTSYPQMVSQASSVAYLPWVALPTWKDPQTPNTEAQELEGGKMGMAL